MDRATQEKILADIQAQVRDDWPQLSARDQEMLSAQLTRTYVTGWNAAISRVADLRAINHF